MMALLQLQRVCSERSSSGCRTRMEPDRGRARQQAPRSNFMWYANWAILRIAHSQSAPTEKSGWQTSDPDKMGFDQRPFAEALVDGTAQRAPNHVTYRTVVAARRGR